MKQKKIKIKISDKINTEDVVHLGKTARERLGLTNLDNSYLEVWSDPFVDSRLYKVKRAFSEDLKGIPREDKTDTCFISPAEFQKIENCSPLDAVNKQFWISTKKSTCIGSDPEFIVYSNIKDNIMIYASEILDFDSDIGSDGPLAELRALPGLTSEEHVNNLDTLIRRINDELDPEVYQCRILPYADCRINRYSNIDERPYKVSCGGHIHFGLTKKITDNPHIHEVIVNILDRTLALCMHRLDKDLGYKRRALDYGYVGDYRSDESQYRLEYRVLSGTWLLYKDLSEIVLGVANSFVESITTRVSKFFDTIDSYSLNIGGEKQESFIANELFPELSEMITNYDYATVNKMLTNIPANDSKSLTHIQTVLECMSQFVESQKFRAFSQIILLDHKNYDNLNSDFINNWTSDISVFDHLNEKKNKKKKS